MKQANVLCSIYSENTLVKTLLKSVTKPELQKHKIVMYETLKKESSQAISKQLELDCEMKIKSIAIAVEAMTLGGKSMDY